MCWRFQVTFVEVEAFTEIKYVWSCKCTDITTWMIWKLDFFRKIKMLFKKWGKLGENICNDVMTLFIVRNWRNKKGWKLAKNSGLTIVFNTFLGFVIILESFKGWFCLKNWHFSLENNRCTFLKIDFREIKLVFLYFKSIFSL